MTSTASPTRVEPTIDPESTVSVTSSPAAELRAAVETPTAAPASASPSPSPSPPAADLDTPARGGIDQLSRIEDKTARIEEKYARSEAFLVRVADKVEGATSRMSEVAQQADLAAVRQEVSTLAGRVRSLPGLTALVFTAIVTALLSSGLTVALLKYLPGTVAQ
jgi:hypothetical protein